jgi:dienelactone hydrolase
MRLPRNAIVSAVALLVLSAMEVRPMPKAGTLPEKDRRATEIRRLDTPCALATYSSLEQWQARAAQLRQQILASAGLLPMPTKTPLKARVFGRTERDGYTLEKAYFESYPGFLATGNLYRPRGKKGPFPGVLCPHGHWQYGRLQDSPEGSVPGRCIALARQGYVVFSYDMVGYNDSNQVGHGRLGAEREQLWGVSLMGLQLWNSIRAVDFLCSLRDVDSKRIGCTGASGGGTQTFLLTAVDDRVKVSAPVCMISAHFQGGCICENGPNLRLDTNNVEIGALAAPRPLLLVSATGDWTKNTPNVEYPWIRDIYRLFKAEDRVENAHFEAGHNYNRQSREAVYQWFGRWLLGSRDSNAFKEQSFHVEQVRDLLVFYGEKCPQKRTDARLLTEHLIRQGEAQLESAWPKDRPGLARFRKQYEPAFRHAVAARMPSSDDIIVAEGQPQRRAGCVVQPLTIGRAGKGDRVPAVLLTPERRGSSEPATLVVHGNGKAAIAGGDGSSLHPLAARLLESGRIVLAIDCFGIGEAAHEAIAADGKYFTTYNRAEIAERVQDILTALAYLDSRADVGHVEVVGLEEAGLWCLLARALAPAVESCAVDVQKFKMDSDAEFVKRLCIPMLRRAGDIRTAVALAAPRRLLIHNTATAFSTAWITRLYSDIGAAGNFTGKRILASDRDLAQFLTAGTQPSRR